MRRKRKSEIPDIARTERHGVLKLLTFRAILPVHSTTLCHTNVIDYPFRMYFYYALHSIRPLHFFFTPLLSIVSVESHRQMTDASLGCLLYDLFFHVPILDLSCLTAYKY